MKKKTKEFNNRRAWLYVCTALVLLALVLVIATAAQMHGSQNKNPLGPGFGSSENGTADKELPPLASVEIDTDAEDAVLDGILAIRDVGSYAGLYMEDGSNEVVSGVMMLIVENISGKDLEYAEITLTFGDKVMSFSISTLKAGAKAVLLEKTRGKYPGQEPDAVHIANVVYFETPMQLYSDVFEISGVSGALNIRNLTDIAITGDIFVYYKNAATDLYYGGITYRARIEGGLAPGETKQIMTGHYSINGSEIVMVQYTG
ncbi:MAG: hypothetical protein J6S76_03485 [Clostridia bacterium]|nr:hypothetical protein [Clostridia bacterium]